MNKIILLLVILSYCGYSCSKTTTGEVLVYSNDFETNNLKDLENGVISSFNGNRMLGAYNNGGFKLVLNNLPEHKIVKVSFDLYIHDSWDGNKTSPDGPDIWLFKANNKTYINTTFSNMPCVAGDLCSPQAFPDNYPNNNHNPKSGALRTDLPGRCQNTQGTSYYHIERTIGHSGTSITLECLDQLVQSNTADAKCDESWSLDNLKIVVADL